MREIKNFISNNNWWLSKFINDRNNKLNLDIIRKCRLCLNIKVN